MTNEGHEAWRTAVAPGGRADGWALVEAALEAAAAAGADYAEARLVARRRQVLRVRDGQALGGDDLTDLGLGVRARAAGERGDGWGLGATCELTVESVQAAAAQAVEAARVVAAGARERLPRPVAATGVYVTEVAEDPFALSDEDKLALLRGAHEAMMSVEGVSSTKGGLMAHRQETLFGASNGSRQAQRVTLCGGGIQALAPMPEGGVQVRSYPKAFEGQLLQGGFEVVRGLGLVAEAPRVAREAAMLAVAEPVPAGPTTVVLDGAQLSLQIHESVGHPTELDRVFGEEISLAGASFLLPDALDALTFGSEHVHLTADATTPYGPGTFGFDDEGTPATATPLVEAGRFVGYLSGRDSAARLGRPSGAAVRAESWSHQPIVRMVNVNLEPGQGDLEALLAGIDEGLMLSVNRSWSIDDLRLNFQFACEAAWEIRDGALTGKVYRDPVYFGITPEFWGRCTGVAGREAWQVWGWAFCGKGDPGQVMYVGHGCAPARFEGVEVRPA